MLQIRYFGQLKYSVCVHLVNMLTISVFATCHLPLIVMSTDSCKEKPFIVDWVGVATLYLNILLQ